MNSSYSLYLSIGVCVSEKFVFVVLLMLVEKMIQSKIVRKRIQREKKQSVLYPCNVCHYILTGVRVKGENRSQYPKGSVVLIIHKGL